MIPNGSNLRIELDKLVVIAVVTVAEQPVGCRQLLLPHQRTRVKEWVAPVVRNKEEAGFVCVRRILLSRFVAG